MSKKPYIYRGFEWLEIVRKTDWNDPSVNPNDLAPYSEFQKPYLNEDGDHDYPSWEWTWPPFSWPPIDDVTYPDPGEPSPCSIDENCVWAGIIGPSEMECGDCYPFTQAHIFYGCAVAPWWAAFGSWTIDSQTTNGECYFLFANPLLIATVCCDEFATGMFILKYEGPLDCKGGVEVDVTCVDVDCCELIALTGSLTQGVGTTWTGTISPACPGAECEVTSNSGCTLSCGINGAGSEVTVAVGGGDCGSFTVTVDGPGSGGSCPQNSDSITVKITGNGGDWKLVTTNGPGFIGCTTGVCCGCSNQTYAPCISGGFKYGTGQDPFTGNNACRDNWSRQCKGEANEPCSSSNSAPPCDSDKSCASDSHPSCGRCDVDGGCCCMNHSYWKCEWKCTC